MILETSFAIGSVGSVLAQADASADAITVGTVHAVSSVTVTLASKMESKIDIVDSKTE